MTSKKLWQLIEAREECRVRGNLAKDKARKMRFYIARGVLGAKIKLALGIMGEV